MWPAAVAAEPVRAVLQRATALRQQTIRLWGTLEADLAATLRRLEAEIGDLEISTCLREGELEIVTRYAPAAQDRYDALRRRIETEYAATAFSTDSSTVEDVVATALIGLGWTIATAESCTGGLLAGRLTDRPGSSGHVRGGVVVYDNEAKVRLAGVPPELLETHGAVSRSVADALAQGARRALHSDVGVGVTGIAGPDGGSPDKPVGTVHLSIVTPTATRHRELHLSGDRAAVRRRTVVTALHELRRMLT
jgi:nicotinamide-nucleotide amidase